MRCASDDRLPPAPPRAGEARHGALRAQAGHAVVVAGLLLLATGGILAFRWSTGDPLAVVPVHLALVAAGALAAVAIDAACAPRRPDRRAPWLLAVLPGSLGSALLALYLVDGFARATWGFNVSAELLLSFASRPSALTQGRGASGVLVGLAALLLAGAPYLAAVAVYRRWPVRGLASPGRRALALLLALALAAGAVAVAYQAVYVRRTLPTAVDEPLLSLFRKDWYPRDPAGAAARLRYPKPAPGRRANVIYIVLDSVRADHLSLYGYSRETMPFLRSLAATGRLHRVEQGWAVCPDSVCGIMALLASHRRTRVGPFNFTLNQLLRDQGYRDVFIASGTHERWYDLSQLYGRPDFFVDSDRVREFPDSDDRAVQATLAAHPPADGRPTFFFFHLMSAHTAALKLEQFREVFAPADVPWDWFRRPDEVDPERLRNYYDNGLLQADHFVRTIFGLLERKGYLRDAVVVLTADHGEALGERSLLGHVRHLDEGTLRVPLLLYDTDPAPWALDGLASQLDVAPTVLARLGLPVPAVWEGLDLAGGGRRRDAAQDTWIRDGERSLLLREGDGLRLYVERQGEGRLFEVGDGSGAGEPVTPERRRELAARLDTLLAR